jgi:hypothetical protein
MRQSEAGRAGNRVVLVGALQQQFLPQQVTTAGQPDDAARATRGGAFEAHKAFTQGVDGFTFLAYLEQRFTGPQFDLGDVAVHIDQHGFIQHTKQRHAAHAAALAGARGRVFGVQQVQRCG